MKSKKITQAIMITGAAARISHEVALLDALMDKKGLKINEDNTMLAGFSSGSLNLLALNMAFCKNSPISWEDNYKAETLFKLTNDKVFKKRRDGKISIFDTKPLRKTLNYFKGQKNINYLQDLPFYSYILTYSIRGDETVWAKNFGSKNQKNLDATDTFMASTAIPIVFPMQKIDSVGPIRKRKFPRGRFVDGGTNGCFDNFEKELKAFQKSNGTLNDLYIVSPMRINDEEIDTNENKIEEGISDKFKEAIGKFTSKMSFNGFLEFLEKLNHFNLKYKIAKNIHISIPFLEQNTGILDFNTEKEAYDKVMDWVDKNEDDLAINLDDFIKRYK